MIRRTLCLVALTTALVSTTAACGGSSTTKAESPSSKPARSTSSVASGAHTSSARAGNDDFCGRAGPGNPALAAAAAMSGGADVAKLKSDIDEALAAAPDAIKPDLQKVADVELPILDGKVSQHQIEQQLADPQFQRALEHIAAWSKAHCSAAAG